MRSTFLAAGALALIAAPVSAADVSTGYVQGPGGYYRKSDLSGPYTIDASGVAALVGAGTGSADTVVKSAAAYRGATAVSGGVSQQLMAANTARRGWSFQNQSSGFCYLKIGAAATADNLSYRSAPGNLYETPTSHTSTGAINVLCADTGAPFYATEW